MNYLRKTYFLTEIIEKKVVLWKKSSVKTILLMTKTRVFAIFEKMMIEVSNLKLIFQEVLTMRNERSKQ